MKKLLIVPLLCLIAYAAYAITVPFVITVGGSGDFTFTPQHLYYLAPDSASPAGNDSNSGLDIAHPWRTVNHPVVCGDVILAQPGTYSNNPFGIISTQPTGCPSSSLGIDGTGGIYVVAVVCAGASVGDCLLNGTVPGCSPGSPARCAKGQVDVSVSNWAFEGWAITDPTLFTRGFAADGCANDTSIIHHIASINTITYNINQGYTTADCSYNFNVPGNGVDYWAVVGSLAQNSAQDVICLAAIDFVGAANSDSNSGTHTYIAGNFGFANQVTCSSDGEAFMVDSPDVHGYSGTIVFKDNIGVRSTRFGVQLFDQNTNTAVLTFKAYQNTMYGNGAGPSGDNGSNQGEFNMHSTTGGWTWNVTLDNNIGQAQWTHTNGGSTLSILYGAVTDNNTTWGSTAPRGNFFFGVSGQNTIAFNGGSFGSNNSTVSPAFKNVTDLIANHMGTPNCSGFENVTACMGWNQGSQTITALSVIDDLTPTASGTTGKGYQTPKPCAADTDYPAWLKGIVYLKASGYVNGATITEKAGLISKPCNM